MKKQFLRINKIFFIIMLLFLNACQSVSNREEKSKINVGLEKTLKELTIFHTNDMHANINQFPKMVTVVNDARVAVKDSQEKAVLLMSAGDSFTGNAYVDQATPVGQPMVELMNKVGYDVAAIGNHEFDLGQERLQKVIDDSKFPYISANIKTKAGSPLKPINPYKIFTVDGVKIMVIGLLQRDAQTGIPASHPSKLTNLEFVDGINEVQKYLDIKKQENVDLFIVLSHMGIEDDRKIAEKYHGIDLIIGGHSHSINDEVVGGEEKIVQIGGNGKFLGKTILTIENGKVKLINHEKLEYAKLTTVKEDAETRTMVDKYNNEPKYKEIIGKAEADILGKNQLAHLMTEGCRADNGFDMYFQNGGGVRIPDKITAGDITLATIFQLDPFGNKVARIQMTATEIKELISYSILKNGSVDLYVSGISYVAKCEKKAKLDVNGKPVLDNNGKPIYDYIAKEITLTKNEVTLDETKTYNVGMNDYIASSYKFSAQTRAESFEMSSAESLIHYIRSKGSIKPDTTLNNEVVNQI